MAPKKILFAAYGASHIRTLLPVITRLQARRDIHARVLALTTARAPAEKAGCDVVGFSDLWRECDERAREIGEVLAADVDHTVVSREETIAYMGLSYAEHERSVGHTLATETFNELGRGAFLPTETVGRLLDDFSPELVVTTNSPRAERAAIEAAGIRNIPSLAIGDLFIMESVPWMARNGYGTRIAVLGEWVKRRLVAHGRDPGDIVITGNPGLDYLKAPQYVDGGRKMREALGWQECQILTWAMASIRPMDEALITIQEKIALLKRMTEQNRSLRVVVRPHPNQKLEFGTLSSSFHMSNRDEDIVSLVHASDLVMTEFSMVGFEAALLGKPVVAIGQSGQLPYQELGLAREVDKLEDLADTLLQASSHELRPRMDLLGAPPLGEATDRVIQEIDDLLAGATAPSTTSN